MTTTTHSLTSEQVEAYRRDGYLILSGVFSAGEVARMAAEAVRILDLMLNASLATGEVSPRLDMRTRDGLQVVRKIQPINDLSDYLRAVSEDPRLLQPMRDLMGCEPVLMEEKLNYKQALQQSVAIATRPDDDGFPFHHDWGYYKAQGYPKETLSSAVSIDESTPDNGPIRVIPRSHLRDWPLSHDGKGPEIAEGVFTYQDAIDVLAPAGSVMLFHSALVHHSLANQTQQPRRIMIYSHYPSTHSFEPDARNRRGRERGQQHEARYREMVASGAYTDQVRTGTAG
jgi:ectoine hydroxylase-related dioxygenase (phytanoyl-CoA dioxygenase family)